MLAPQSNEHRAHVCKSLPKPTMPLAFASHVVGRDYPEILLDIYYVQMNEIKIKGGGLCSLWDGPAVQLAFEC
jgi:hypothetical protein